MGAIEVAFRGVFVSCVEDAPFISERIHEIAPDLWFEAGPVPQLRYIGQELRVVADSCVGNFESPVSRPERDRDLSLRAIFAHDFDTSHHSVERRETLLAIDDQGRGP